MIVLVIRSSIIIITCREGCWHNRHSMFWTSSSLLRQCQTLVGILIIFCHLSVHLFRFFLDDPAKSLWWYFGDDDGHDDKDDTFVSSMTATKLLRELIPNFPVPLQPDASHNHWRNQHTQWVHARNTIPTKWRQKYLKYKNLHSDLLGPPSSCPSHRSSDLEESGLGREIVNRLLIVS